MRTATGQSEDVPNSDNNIQEQAITNYCETNYITLCEVFHDYYANGANFERIGWKQLEDYLKGVPDFIDLLIVSRYDRIGRNTEAVVEMIGKLKKHHGITVLSLEDSKFPEEELAQLLTRP